MRRVIVGMSVLVLVACDPLTTPPPATPGPTPVAASAPAPTPSAPADAAAQDRVGVDDMEVKACNGESVSLSGELHMVTKTKGSTTEDHVNGHMTGVGDQGNDYVFNLQVKASSGGEPFAMTLTDRQLLVSKGPAPNQRVTVVIAFPPLTFDMQTVCTG